MNHHHASRLYLENFLQCSPYLSISIGIGANNRANPARIVNPQPCPNFSISGAVVNGKNVLIRHLVTMIPVIAEAEYRPNASTTYAMTGIMANMSAVPMAHTANSRTISGRRSCAAQP